LTKKSARIAGGVILLGGRGPFHAFNLSGLGIRSPGSEEDAGLAPSDGLAVLDADEDLARSTLGGAAAAFLSHDLDSAQMKGLFNILYTVVILLPATRFLNHFSIYT
jgi:hypothetical protein